MRATLALIAVLALAGCKPGGDAANNSTPVTSATAVPTIAPPAGKQWTDVVEKTADGGYRMGNPKAPIQLVEYGSRSCPHCKRFDDESGPLRDKYVASGRVSYEFRDFLIHPQIDTGAAMLGHCVAPEAFFAILDAMFAAQEALVERAQHLPPDAEQTLSKLNAQQAAAWWAEQAGYVDFMKQHGVPEPTVRACLADPKGFAEANDVQAKATTEMDVNSTPTFFINGVKANASEWAELEPALQAAGAR